MSNQEVTLMARIDEANERVAQGIARRLAEKGIYGVNVMGSPGAGKTSCLIRIIQGLGNQSAYVVEGDIQSTLDTDKLRALGVEAVQLHTGGACHIDGALLEKTLPQLSLDAPGFLFVENIGNLVCPAEFDIGERMKLLIVTVADGSDKPYKYPLAFEKAKAILLNKADLLPYVDFDMDMFMKGIRALNPQAQVFTVSCRTGQGFDEVCQWLLTRP